MSCRKKKKTKKKHSSQRPGAAMRLRSLLCCCVSHVEVEHVVASLQSVELPSSVHLIRADADAASRANQIGRGRGGGERNGPRGSRRRRRRRGSDRCSCSCADHRLGHRGLRGRDDRLRGLVTAMIRKRRSAILASAGDARRGQWGGSGIGRLRVSGGETGAEARKEGASTARRR